VVEKMIIGKEIETQTDLAIDFNKLINSRLLVQANSGGGKSWLIRKILEESYGKSQQIILDIEGEFSSLREKYDYLLVGPEGEIPATIKTASILPKKLLELNTSTIIDLSELKHHERILYVKRFLEGLMNVPKKLWHALFLVIDEANQFCPQSGKCESGPAVIDLMTRGRKRGFCGALATQRISKLHKDACAEANNRLIGRTGLDIDRKRASEELGFTSKQDTLELRNLKAGEFFAFGTAICTDIKKIKVGNVKTSHPEIGRVIKSSPTPKNITNILKKLTDLPKEADKELRSKEDMKIKITQLKREIRVLENQNKNPKQLIDQKTIDKMKWDLQIEQNKKFKQLEVDYVTKIRKCKSDYYAEFNKINAIRKILEIKVVAPNTDAVATLPAIVKPNLEAAAPLPGIVQPIENNIQNNESKPLRAGAMKILGWICAAYPNSLSKQRIATLSGFSMRGGTFNTYISELKRNGWITNKINNLIATQEGLNNTVEEPTIPTGEELLNLWASKFRAGAGKLLRIIYSKHPFSITKVDLGLEANMEYTGGTFNTYLSELRRNSLIHIESGEATISEDFFES
jgi:uncharacterized protein DUF87